ncbi:TPA: hypothetical protein O9P59_002089 [Staphylococcus aureus]|nr:hypothetical protein [Staphylococcus aureus]HDG9890948.1 hypothetical protein [Staphylococcus aureus]
MSLFDRLSVLKNKSEIKLIESKQVVEDKVFEIRHGKLDDIPMTKERKRSEKTRIAKEEQEKRDVWIKENVFKIIVNEEGKRIIFCPKCGSENNVTATTWNVDEAENSEDIGTYFKRTCNLCGHSQKFNKDNPKKIYE